MSELTLEKIAELSGVSRSTVSRVINQQAGVKPEVRERVLQVMAETGYQPDPAAQPATEPRPGLIGLMIPRSAQLLFEDLYYPLLMQGLAQACNAHNYILSPFLFRTENEEQKLTNELLHNQLVDGIIVSALPIGAPLVSRLLDHKLPFVMIGRPDDPAQISFVDVDNGGGAYKAVSHLMQLGYRRTATITGPLNTLAAQERRQGYLKVLDDHGVPVVDSLIIEGDFTEHSGYLAMQHLIPYQPEAVFVASDTMALGALRALRTAGLTVPDDVAIVGFDDLPHAATANPPLTTVRQPIHRLGMQAVDSLVDILQNGPQPPRHFVIETELIVRRSCGSDLKK